MPPVCIDPDIRRAHTLAKEVYRDPQCFELQRERVFARSWQFVTQPLRLDQPGRAVPLNLLEGCLDEPLLFTRDSDRVHCLSNVCTHRANLLVEAEACVPSIRCRYHGRRFDLAGRFVSMPEFELAENFPTEADDLPRVQLANWSMLHFVALAPAISFETLIAPVRSRLDWLPLDRFEFVPSASRDYVFNANWALYCDNYLEGLHIPFVHPGLAATLDFGAYATETFEHGSLQIGVARPGEAAFDVPEGHRDHGQSIAAYYFWLYPNTMLNFYPWGLSVNVVAPLGVDRTRVSFHEFVLDPARRSDGAGADLHGVELEDEAVVEAVHKGMRSRLYRGGRYSPTREIAVHHFHRLLAQALEHAE